MRFAYAILGFFVFVFLMAWVFGNHLDFEFSYDALFVGMAIVFAGGMSGGSK